MGTIQDLSQLNLHTMQVDTLAIDFGGVMSDFIDRDTLGLLANIAQVPLEIFEIPPYWEKRDKLDSGEYDAFSYFHQVLIDCRSPVRDDEEILELLFTIDLLGFSHIRPPKMVKWVHDMRRGGGSRLCWYQIWPQRPMTVWCMVRTGQKRALTGLSSQDSWGGLISQRGKFSTRHTSRAD